MPYNITRSNGTVQVIQDNVIDTAKYSIAIPGRGVFSYGSPYANTVVNMLENFAGPTAPARAVPGQLWYNTTTGAIMVNKGVNDTTPDWQPTGFLGAEGNPVPAAFITTIGSVTTPVANIYGGIFNGTAVQARYADLAERYEIDVPVEPGTIVMFGGDKEITVANHIEQVFGVISTNPAYVMNHHIGNTDTHPAVALHGRTPVKVFGIVSKFDYIGLHPDYPGVGVVTSDKSVAIGRALESSTVEGIKPIECYVNARM